MWTVRVQTAYPAICSESPITVYTVAGGSITYGYVIYYDAGLTTKVTGYTLIVEATGGEVRDLDPFSAAIGLGTGQPC